MKNGEDAETAAETVPMRHDPRSYVGQFEVYVAAPARVLREFQMQAPIPTKTSETSARVPARDP